MLHMHVVRTATFEFDMEFTGTFAIAAFYIVADAKFSGLLCDTTGFNINVFTVVTISSYLA